MNFAIGGLGLIVIAACAVVFWRAKHEGQDRRLHLRLLSAGFMLSVWGNLVALVLITAILADEGYALEWAKTLLWILQIGIFAGLMLIAGGLTRLTWFMWLRNGSLNG